MNRHDQAAIDAASHQTLAEWWCILNRWEWPAEGLGEPDPVAVPYRPDRRRWQIMGAILRRIGLDACLREWNRPESATADSGRNGE
jgi:hypothetical protein